MVLGQAVAIVGTALLTRITVTTRYVLVAVYLVISGIGFGMGLQMPFTGVQTVLRCVNSPHIIAYFPITDLRSRNDEVLIGNGKS